MIWVWCYYTAQPRKLSLTEAGASFCESAKDMVSLCQSKDVFVLINCVMSLRVTCVCHYAWIGCKPHFAYVIDVDHDHDDLSIHFQADNEYVNMIEERIDIAVRMSPNILEQLISTPIDRSTSNTGGSTTSICVNLIRLTAKRACCSANNWHPSLLKVLN